MFEQAVLIPDCESQNRFYLEIANHLRYIYENGVCIGRYDPCLPTII